MKKLNKRQFVYKIINKVGFLMIARDKVCNTDKSDKKYNKYSQKYNKLLISFFKFIEDYLK